MTESFLIMDIRNILGEKYTQIGFRYEEAAPLLENIFYVREKLLTISNLHVLQCLCELVATMDAVNKKAVAFAYVKVAVKSFELVKGKK